MLALQSKGFTCEWWDARQGEGGIYSSMCKRGVVGLLLSMCIDDSWLGLLPGRHWLAIRCCSVPGGASRGDAEALLLLDSKLPEPVPLEVSAFELRIGEVLQQGGSVIIVLQPGKEAALPT